MLRAVAVLLVAIGTAAGDDSIEAVGEPRELFSQCAPMDVVVEDLNPQYALWVSNLTKKDIADVAESRLLAEQLYASPDDQTLSRSQYLYVNVGIHKQALSIDISLKRFLRDLGYGIPGVVEVWRRGSIGLHDGNGQHILEIVTRLVDIFIADYRRVNTYLKASGNENPMPMQWCRGQPRYEEIRVRLTEYEEIHRRLKETEAVENPDIGVMAERRVLEEEACKIEDDVYGVTLSPWCE